MTNMETQKWHYNRRESQKILIKLQNFRKPGYSFLGKFMEITEYKMNAS